MSRLGFDEQGRALDKTAVDEAAEADPLKLAARAQSGDIEAAHVAIEGRDATPENISDLLRHATHLPDPEGVLLAGAQPIWERWLDVLASTPLGLTARRDLVTLSGRLPEATRATVLERVFRVPLGADARAVDAVDDLLEDAAAQPTPTDETETIERDAALHLDGPAAVIDGLFDDTREADALVPELTPMAAAAFGEGVEREVDVVGFVRACAPGIAAERAVAVLGARFGGDEPPADDDPAWWRRVARLRRRFPALVDALEAARSGAPQTVVVQGGFARVDLAAGRLGIYSPTSASASRS